MQSCRRNPQGGKGGQRSAEEIGVAEAKEGTSTQQRGGRKGGQRSREGASVAEGGKGEGTQQRRGGWRRREGGRRCRERERERHGGSLRGGGDLGVGGGGGKMEEYVERDVGPANLLFKHDDTRTLILNFSLRGVYYK